MPPTLRSVGSTCLMPVARRAARRYIVGETLADARRAQAALELRGLQATIGFWDGVGDTPRQVADQYLAALDGLADEEGTTYASIKLPALGFSDDLLAEVAERARATGTRIHLDSLAPDTVAPTQVAVERVLESTPGLQISCTLPGRWRRSPGDVAWATRHAMPVRVVKGEWPDPHEPARDPRAGYLGVIDSLAGRAQRVGVATHDVPLARAAIKRLRAEGTPCELELLHGLPMRESLRLARELRVDVRVYLPYGAAYMPYALSQIRRRPRILLWLLKDLAGSAVRRRAPVTA
jgi:proline dehydrogenase